MSDAAVLRPLPRNEPAPPDWRRSTSADLIRAFEQGKATRFARAIRTSIPFETAQERKPGSAHPYQQMLWSQHAFPEHGRNWISVLHDGSDTAKATRKHRERRNAAIADAVEVISNSASPTGYELLAGLSVLLHDRSLPDDLFLRLWTSLQDAMQSLLKTPPRLAGRLTVDQRLLLLGELPWSYGLVFSNIKGARRAREQAAQHLRHELSQVCDDDGVPHATLLPRLPLCLAPFTRASTLGERTGDDWRDRNSARHYRNLVLRSAALLQPDGRTALSNGVAHDAAALMLTATESAGLKTSHHATLLAASLAATTTGRRERRGTSVAPRLKRKHRPSVQSDTARLACLRNNWGVGADSCIVAFDGPTPRIDFTAFGVPILSGEWGSLLRTAEREQSRPAADWECVCWFSESTADYVELQRTAPDGSRTLRQALLSRDDHFLLLSDIVHAAGDDPIDYTITLPLQAEATAAQDSLTREWALKRGPLALRVLPLGLPQPSIDRADGRLTIDAQSVTLRQTSSGPRLACTLLLDWSPARRKAPARWKQLTVAENGRILSPAESFGAHWRLGDAQWLYYHVLDGSDMPRTVLGHHTFHETVIAEINSSGDVNQLVQVENEAES